MHAAAHHASRNGGKKASLSGRIGTGALKVAVYIKSCPQKTKVTKTKTALKQEMYKISE